MLSVQNTRSWVLCPEIHSLLSLRWGEIRSSAGRHVLGEGPLADTWTATFIFTLGSHSAEALPSRPNLNLRPWYEGLGLQELNLA